MSKGIQKLFSKVPNTYELINHILTFGLDILWRKRAAKVAVTDNGSHWIDICTGTGEMATYLQRFAQKKTMIIAADFSLPMIRKGTQKQEAGQIAFLLADVRSLPFKDRTFDLITISFATRNININRDALIKSLSEFHRILKPAGRFVNLETSQPSSLVMRRLFHKYVERFVKPIGQFLSGSRAGYAYLSHTIPRFYNADEFADIIYQAGFGDVSFNRIWYGIAAIHKAVK
jgi:demethylmenaquinone methyltransferase/2-methoxy-6-polyprenyl-1,4-benzoquinol methylase